MATYYENTGAASTDVVKTTPMISTGTAMGVAGLINSYAASQYQQAQAINQQTSYLVAARDTLATAEVRADMADLYSQVQMGRTLQKANQEALNWKIAGNTLLKSLRSANATARARAAANGVDIGSGSIVATQAQNTQNVMRDVSVADLNGLTAQVLGFEDATAMMQSTQYQNFINLYQAQRQAGQYNTAAASARSTGGLLANITLGQGLTTAGKVLL